MTLPTPATLLRLCRAPNVFTALANVLAGAALAGGRMPGPAEAPLFGATALLYAGGMILNDYFDREVDARERPERPIPSGAISARTALALGASSLALGVALAALAGPLPAAIAGSLVAAILAYDARLKDTAAGPWTMGTCRALNILLGASALGLGNAAVLAAALTLGLFTAALTFLSRHEVHGTDRTLPRRVLLAMGMLAAAVAGGVAWLGHALVAFPFLASASARGAQLFLRLRHDTSGPAIGRAIGGGILMMPLVDATWVAATGAWPAALATIAVGAPAYLLRRVFYVT